MTTTFCDHVGVLVRDIAGALNDLGELAAGAAPPEEFPEEGTREVYVGRGSAKLLLLQPIGPGPYRRALERRGPGLHHVCLAGSDPRALMESLPGWLLHPYSLTSGPDTLWACRPGLPLVEMVRGTPGGEPFVTAVELACPPGVGQLARRLSRQGTPVSRGQTTRIGLRDRWWVPPD